MSIKEQLRPLEWKETQINGKFFSWIADSALHDYQILYDHIGKEYTIFYYERLTKDRGHKRGKTTDELKEWAENTHYPSKMAKWLNPDPLTQTLNWFKVAKPEPNSKDIITQIGCHYEEVAEMAESLCRPRETEFSKITRVTSQYFKEADTAPDHDINDIVPDPTETLDSLADQIVTAVGVAYMMGFDIIGALKEVNASNYSKFVDGKAVTDENGKIIKGENYFKPDLEPFVGDK